MAKRKKIVCKFDKALEVSRPIVLEGHKGRLDFVKVLPNDTIISGSWDGVRKWNIVDQPDESNRRS